MHHIRGVPRHQIALLPAAIEDFVSVDHPVRVVDAFVESLDLASLGFGKAEPEATGRPPYDPADLLKLFLYGYLNRLRSSRILERECGRNVELMWLMGRLTPDFKTIANFRKENAEPLRGVCRAFVGWCGKQGLLGGELVAIDGTKVQAASSMSGVVTTEGLRQAIEHIDGRVARYLSELDENDAAESQAAETTSAGEALKALVEQRAELQALVEQMIASDRRQIHAGEREAVMMGPGRGVVGYNVQTAVDEKNKLIVHHEVVTEANDRQQLFSMATAAKAELGSEHLKVIADAGYHNAEQAHQCEELQIEPAVPTQRNSNQYAATYFSKENFTYDPATDTYRCPAGAVMTRRKTARSDRRRRYVTRACYTCPLRPQCTSGRQRKITRSEHEDAAVRADQRAREPNNMRRRASLVEHPFAWIKRTLDRRFIGRGLRNAKAEIALAITSYNLLRVINLIGARRIVALLPA